ncbi:MAG TPA: hypothetical protein VH482_14390 [Thermomicrobiales bacterium]|jgi:hypothetical protein
MERDERGPRRIATVDANEAFRSYELGLVTLARLGELLGTDRRGAIAFVESRGLTVEDGPASVEDALEDAKVIERLRSRPC